MTDLELIEAAAKAAGHQTAMCYEAWPEGGEPFAYAKLAKRTYFRPFSDDGDAFRLASVIGLIVNFASPIGESVSVKFYDIEVCVPVEGDRGAAARRAIVLAAARCATPAPAQPDPWHDAVLAECMAIEGAYKSDDPAATLRALIDWHVANERRAEPMGEPVALIDRRSGGFRAHWVDPAEADKLPHGTPLYAHPPAASTPAVPADVTPSQASEAWNKLRDLTDSLFVGDEGNEVMRLVRIYAQRQYEAGLEVGAAAPAVPEPSPGAEGAAWQPISTAPIDGTEFLAYTDERTVMVLYWRKWQGRWSDGVSDERWGPTHWMPLPAAPKEKP